MGQSKRPRRRIRQMGAATGSRPRRRARVRGAAARRRTMASRGAQCKSHYRPQGAPHRTASGGRARTRRRGAARTRRAPLQRRACQPCQHHWAQRLAAATRAQGGGGALGKPPAASI
eukprot:2510770-Pyramimonas_sp.AAC.1